MHSKIQKQFMELDGMPVLCYSLRCFQESPLIQDIILVTGEESISYCKEEIVQKYGFTKVSAVIPGGKERYDSVYAGLCECKDCEYVLIHDGARPFVTEEILKRGLQKVKETGACVIGMPSKDTVILSDRLFGCFCSVLRSNPNGERRGAAAHGEKVPGTTKSAHTGIKACMGASVRFSMEIVGSCRRA